MRSSRINTKAVSSSGQCDVGAFFYVRPSPGKLRSQLCCKTATRRCKLKIRHRKVDTEEVGRVDFILTAVTPSGRELDRSVKPGRSPKPMSLRSSWYSRTLSSVRRPCLPRQNLDAKKRRQRYDRWPRMPSGCQPQTIRPEPEAIRKDLDALLGYRIRTQRRPMIHKSSIRNLETQACSQVGAGRRRFFLPRIQRRARSWCEDNAWRWQARLRPWD